MKKILGMGNALMDVLIELENDELLHTFNLPKGSMQLIDHEKAQQIEKATSHLNKTLTTGGSASNTIHGIAHLGKQCGFIGKVGKDGKGKQFINDMRLNRITPLLIESDSMTGFATAFVSKDGERTFATFLGAAAEMTPDDLSPELFDGYAIFHIEGYLVQNHELIKKAVILAKQKGLKVSLDLASYNVVEANYDFLHDLVKNYVDIVFANEEEAKAFTQAEPEEALEKIATICEVAVVKIGPQGSWVKRGNEKHRIHSYPSQRKDTTGAGDMYASGFLYGLANNYPLEVCGKIGSYLSSQIVAYIGPKFPNLTWRNLLIEVGKIESENK